jgi:hypothetical protein
VPRRWEGAPAHVASNPRVPWVSSVGLHACGVAPAHGSTDVWERQQLCRPDDLRWAQLPRLVTFSGPSSGEHHSMPKI